MFKASRMLKGGYNLEKNEVEMFTVVEQRKKRVFAVWNESSLDWLCVAKSA